MIYHANKTMVRLPFEAVLELLKSVLSDDGFEVDSTTDFQKPSSGIKVTYGKYKILSAYQPFFVQRNDDGFAC